MTSRKKLKPPQQEKAKKLVTPSDKQEIPPEQQPPVFSLRYLEGEYCLTVVHNLHVLARISETNAGEIANLNAT
jgi:hypothetical protein